MRVLRDFIGIMYAMGNILSRWRGRQEETLKLVLPRLMRDTTDHEELFKRFVAKRKRPGKIRAHGARVRQTVSFYQNTISSQQQLEFLSRYHAGNVTLADNEKFLVTMYHQRLPEAAVAFTVTHCGNGAAEALLHNPYLSSEDQKFMTNTIPATLMLLTPYALPAEMLREYAQSHDVRTLTTLSQRPDLPDDVFDKLACHPNLSVQKALFVPPRKIFPETFPVAMFEAHRPQQLKDLIKAAGLDDETLQSLKETCPGSLKDLIETCSLLGPSKR